MAENQNCLIGDSWKVSFKMFTKSVKQFMQCMEMFISVFMQTILCYGPVWLKTGISLQQFIIKVLYSASHLRVVPENVGLQKEQKCNIFACHTSNEVRLCVLGIRKKEVGNTKRYKDNQELAARVVS
jgi:hypothetical protein